MSARFINKGRADPWRTHHPYRPVANVQPMDCDREPILMWAWMLAAVFLSPFVAAFLSWSAQ